MVVSIIIATALSVVFMFVRVTVGAKSTKGGVIACLLKALASVGFIMIAVIAMYTTKVRNCSVFVLAGLVMGLIGDIVLDLKVIYAKTEEEGIYLTGGMASFGIGHVFYFVAMIIYFSGTLKWSHVGICIAVAAVVAFAIIFGGEKLLKLNFGKFIVHSVIYAFILLFMTAIGITAWVVCKPVNAHVPLLSVGFILFLLSDLVLTQMYFGGRPNDKTLCVINHTLYYAAQICIAAFVFFMA